MYKVEIGVCPHGRDANLAIIMTVESGAVLSQIVPIGGTLFINVETVVEKGEFVIAGAIEMVVDDSGGSYSQRVTICPAAALTKAYQAWQDAKIALRRLVTGAVPADESSELIEEEKLLRAQYRRMDYKGTIVFRSAVGDAVLDTFILKVDVEVVEPD